MSVLVLCAEAVQLLFETILEKIKENSPDYPYNKLQFFSGKNIPRDEWVFNLTMHSFSGLYWKCISLTPNFYEILSYLSQE